MEVCNTQKYNGVPGEALRLLLFPFSLNGKAQAWLNYLPRDSVVRWEDLMTRFLNKFFPPSKASKLRENITSFAQLDNETIYEAWERYKEALRKCPNHGIPDWLEIDMFYKGLLPTTRTLIDAASGGALNRKTKDDAYKLHDEMASNSYQWPNYRAPPSKVVGVLELDAITAL